MYFHLKTVSTQNDSLYRKSLHMFVGDNYWNMPHVNGFLEILHVQEPTSGKTTRWLDRNLSGTALCEEHGFAVDRDAIVAMTLWSLCWLPTNHCNLADCTEIVQWQMNLQYNLLQMDNDCTGSRQCTTEYDKRISIAQVNLSDVLKSTKTPVSQWEYRHFTSCRSLGSNHCVGR
jgi:hypothetical protein